MKNKNVWIFTGILGLGIAVGGGIFAQTKYQKQSQTSLAQRLIPLITSQLHQVMAERLAVDSPYIDGIVTKGINEIRKSGLSSGEAELSLPPIEFPPITISFTPFAEEGSPVAEGGCLCSQSCTHRSQSDNNCSCRCSPAGCGTCP